MRLIHNPQSVTCPICSKSFKTKLYLKRHLVSFHDVNPSDRQLQEEIYQHQLKVQVQGQSATQQQHQQVQNGVDTQQNNDTIQNVSSPLSQQQNSNDDSNGTGEGKLRAYHAQIGDSAYPVEVVQINESKNFGNIVQFNATF